MAPDLLEHLHEPLLAGDSWGLRGGSALPVYDARGRRREPREAAVAGGPRDPRPGGAGGHRGPRASSPCGGGAGATTGARHLAPRGADAPGNHGTTGDHGTTGERDTTGDRDTTDGRDTTDTHEAVGTDAVVPQEPAHLAIRRERTRLLGEIETVAQAAPDQALAAWLDDLDPSTVPVEILVEAVAASARLEAAAHARTLSLAAALARRPEMEPAWNDDVGPLPRHRSVAADELSMRLGVSRVVANRLVREGQVLDLVLPATGAALAAGDLDAAKVSVLVQRLGNLDLRVAEAVEDLVLPEAPERSTAQVRLDVERALREVDPDGAAARHELARTGRRVSRPRPEPDGMASMWLVLAAEDATRVDGVLEHTARAARVHGDPHPRAAARGRTARPGGR